MTKESREESLQNALARLLGASNAFAKAMLEPGASGDKVWGSIDGLTAAQREAAALLYGD